MQGTDDTRWLQRLDSYKKAFAVLEKSVFATQQKEMFGYKSGELI